MNNLSKNINKWLNADNQRISLQRLYLVISILSLISASLIGLINYSLGQKVLIIPVISSAIFLLNSIVWALEEAFLKNFLPLKPAITKKKTNKK